MKKYKISSLTNIISEPGDLRIFQRLTLLQEDRMLIIYSDNLSLFRFQLI